MRVLIRLNATLLRRSLQIIGSVIKKSASALIAKLLVGVRTEPSFF